MLRDLVAARHEGDAQGVSAVLADDVSYWDCERGDLAGRDAVTAALVALGPAELETIAVADDAAVLEVQVGPGAHCRSTEVYRLAGGSVVSIKAYFDPQARQAAGL